ncbi:helix-turn-helix domain-containing protein [Streptomyces rochei]|uniref:helix-turn-helix domain-containing protein n=1 Tax=Streptomyces rochei TaxID=1928 RepID=UPI002ACDCED5|nr:helix-turn-helix domain-containing protein [Streptomyces rochei]WQC10335.1 helix-turn-helix domain-containing protein [Streptomyces rochei]WQC17340.1 helix-turn-helix domain-containing protein [Streptomyces rochei]
MQYERNGNGDSPALTELRGKLSDGLARNRINKTELARRSGLGRTTVSEAFQVGGPVPSAYTVEALARALKLPVGELLALRRDADADGGGQRPVPGLPIGQWEPHALEVHPAGASTRAPGSDAPGARVLPGYVERGHDLVLAEAVRDAAAGRSRMVVLVGGSSTGKTRACWEAVQPLADMGWRLWHPFDPTRAEAALDDLHRVAPKTVVWLNEAQHYLGDREAGERIAAVLHGLLTAPECGPMLVLGTLWPEYAARYTALPSPGGNDPHSRVRELLSGRTLSVPDAFDAQALATAAALARDGDRLLADALTRADADGRVTQDLAGAPELLNRYERAAPAARAVLEAAMDARRLGVGLHLPQAFLIAAAADYLTDTEYDQLTEDWAEQAFAELAELVHGKQALLRNTTPRPRRRPPTPSPPADIPPPATSGPMFRLADFLEQHGRTARRPLCPPASFWHAALTHLTHPDDLNNLATAAEKRHRLQWAHHLLQRAGDHGSTDALGRLALLREKAGDREGAERLARQAADQGTADALGRLALLRESVGDWEGAERLARQAADHGNTEALFHMVALRKQDGDRESAERLARQAADHGDTGALGRLALLREEAGDREGAERLARQAADHGDTGTLFVLGWVRKKAGDRESGERIVRQAADRGDTNALNYLAQMRKNAGDREGAERLDRQAADHGDTGALRRLALLREEAGDREGAEHLYRQAADHGDTGALGRLALLRESVGDWEGAERLARQAADHRNTEALYRLAEIREEAGDRESAERLARQAADHGDTHALSHLACGRERGGDREGAERIVRQAADQGNTDALNDLAQMREDAGDQEGAEHLYRQAADHGNNKALLRLAVMREEAGDREGAEHLYRQAANFGADKDFLGVPPLLRALTTRWPDGLDADGTPTRPWQ